MLKFLEKIPSDALLIIVIAVCVVFYNTGSIIISAIWMANIVIAAKNHPLVGKDGYFAQKD